MRMSSEMAGKIATAACGEVFPTQPQVAKYVDSQLQEVRAVLVKLAPRTNVDDEGGHCWCSKNLKDDSEPHDKICQRTRTLWQRLLTSEIEITV